MLDSGAAFLWSVGTGTNTMLTSTAGVRLDAGFQVQRSTGGPIDTELLSNTPAFDVAVPGSNGQRIVVSGSVRGSLWAELPMDETLDIVAVLDVGTGPLSTQPARVTRSAPGVTAASAQLVYPDRVVLFGGGNSSALTTTVIWTR